MSVRVRLAPSPTGEVHIGTIWIALFDWIYAKQHQGTFVLRIEDTDRARFVPGSVERLYEALEWIGIIPDEGPQQPGPYGPYTQSERLPLYQQYAEQLLASGHAYHCFCTPERLEEMRVAQQAAKRPPRYDRTCLALSKEEVASRLAAGEPATIRLKMPTEGTLTHHDLIRGDVTFRYDLLDDSVIMKSDGFPTYHLAVVVDDHLMHIDTVLRAEEWLPSVPKHLYLYECLGWEPPRFAHLPLILGTDRSKMSKRHGATSALAFRDAGYLPEAMRNFLVLMGWHPKGDTEVISLDDVINQFDLAEFNPAGAIFDRTKLDWFNGYYIRALAIEELTKRLQPFWNLAAPYLTDLAWQHRVVALVRDRLVTLADINTLTEYLRPDGFDQRLATMADISLCIPKKGTAAQTLESLRWLATEVEQSELFSDASLLKTKIIEKIAASGQKNGGVLWPGRVALSLQAASPDVFDLMVTLGQDETLRRIKAVMAKLN